MAAKRSHWMHMGQWPIYVGITDCPDTFQREIKRLKVKESVDFLSRPGASATCHTFNNPANELCFFIALTSDWRKHTNQAVAAILAHEAVHVVQEMNEVLSPLQRFDRENEAYLVQYITQCCLAFLWRS